MSQNKILNKFNIKIECFLTNTLQFYQAYPLHPPYCSLKEPIISLTKVAGLMRCTT